MKSEGREYTFRIAHETINAILFSNIGQNVP